MDRSESGHFFPTTHWTTIRAAANPEAAAYRQSLDKLAATYWRPVYGHFRRKWGKSHEEAGDLTQDFFAALCEKEFLKHLSREQGRFRSYVMAALDNFARLQYRSQNRLKRGGGLAPLPLEDVEGSEPAVGDTPQQGFLREWARSVLADALGEMRRECRAEGREDHFELFAVRDIRPPEGAEASYEALARRFGVAPTDVTNILYRARKRLRELVLMRVRDTVSSDEEAEAEMRDLFEEREPL